MVTKSITFLNIYLSKIGFKKRKFFLEEEFDSDKEDDDLHYRHYVVSYKEKKSSL